MKNYNLLILVVLCAHLSMAQGTWTQLSDLPGPGRHHACSFVLGDSAYVATGSGLADFYKYDIHNDVWTQLPDFPGGDRNYAIGFAINGKGYISCGLEGSSSNMEMWEFDPLTGAWTQKTSGPAVGRVHPAFSVVGDRVYIGQGQRDGDWLDLDDWYEYNAVTDSWTQKTNFMSARHHGAGATVGNMIYVGTGHYLDNMYDDWYGYNADTDTWQTLSNFTGNGRSAGNAVARAGKIYFVAGEDEIEFARFDDFREYDPVTDAWTTLESFPADGRWAPFMFVHNDTIYVGTGQDEQMVNRKDLWRYNFPAVGLEEIESMSLEIYPNPAKNSVKLPSLSGNHIIDVFNNIGQVVLTKEIHGQELFVGSLSSGMYIIKVRDNGKTGKLYID